MPGGAAGLGNGQLQRDGGVGFRLGGSPCDDIFLFGIFECFSALFFFFLFFQKKGVYNMLILVLGIIISITIK